jgi:hypothetical protein
MLITVRASLEVRKSNGIGEARILLAPPIHFGFVAPKLALNE